MHFIEYVGYLLTLHLFFAVFTVMAIKDSKSVFAKAGYLAAFALATFIISLPFVAWWR